MAEDDEPMIAVCSPDRIFADDEACTCARCGCAIYVRPHTVARVPAPGRVCVGCFLTLARGDADVRMFVSEETIAELALIEACEKFATRRGILQLDHVEIVAQARAAVAQGATHDCGEWVVGGRCELCDREVRHD